MKRQTTLKALRETVLIQHLRSYRDGNPGSALDPICIRLPHGELADLKYSGIRACRLLAAKGLMRIELTVLGEFASVVEAAARLVEVTR